MIDTAIWAASLFAPLMTAVVWLCPAARRAIDAKASVYEASRTEGYAGAQASMAATEERRHLLDVRREAIDEDIAREKALLMAETAQYETDRQAAAGVLEDAKEARRKVIAARAEAEAALAPEAAKRALGGDDMTILAEAYAAFCGQYGYANTPTFGAWIGNFRGLG